MAPKFDDTKLRGGSKEDTIAYLRTLKDVPAVDISKYLLDGVVAERFPPATFGAWLHVSTDPSVTVTALRQTESALTRRFAVKKLVKLLRSPKYFSETWDAVGGSQGLSELLKGFSVYDVKALCRGRLVGSGWAVKNKDLLAKKRKEFSDLLEKLRSGDDKRPMGDDWESLLPTCSDETVEEWMDKSGDTSSTLRRKLLTRRFPERYERECMDAFFGGKKDRKSTRLSEWTPLFRRSMDFCVAFMRKMLQEKHDIAAWEFIHYFAKPQSRRLVRGKGYGVDTQVRVFGLVRDVLSKYEAKEFRDKNVLKLSDDGGLMENIKTLWKRTRGHSDDKVSREVDGILLSLVKIRGGDFDGDHAAYMQDITISQRYSFFRMVFETLYNVDVEESSDEEFKTLEKKITKWPSSFFVKLPVKNALALLRRLTAVYPEDTFILPGSGNDIVVRLAPDYADDRECADIEVVQTYLESAIPEERTAEWEKKVADLLDERKKKAANSRDPGERTKWASGALRLAIATRNTKLVSETFVWARRFNKDPKTVGQLYSEWTIHPGEFLTLLAGAWDSENLPERIAAGNAVVMLLLETAGMAIREPTFSAGAWVRVCELVPLVVTERLKQVAKLGLPDEEKYDVCLKPTIDFLVEAESFWLRDGNEPFGQRLPQGIFIRIDGKLAKSSPPISRFLSELMKARDKLWADRRAKRNPEVMSLDASDLWPKALPIQMHWMNDAPAGKYSTRQFRDIEYLQERAKQVVFVDPKLALSALPDSEEVKKAIWPWVDSYEEAVRVYVNPPQKQRWDQEQSPKEWPAECVERAQKAWDHALNNLRIGDMTRSEAAQFWYRKAFCNALNTSTWELFACYFAKDELEKLRKPEMQLPEVEDPSEPTEWNPHPPSYRQTFEEEVMPRNLPTVRLTWLLNAWDRGSMNTVDFDNPIDLPTDKLTTTGKGTTEVKNFFDAIDADEIVAPKSADEWQHVILNMMMLNSRFGSDSSLFMKPFPSAEDHRYPALYLEQEFLEEQGGWFQMRQVEQAAKELGKRLDIVPPTLLAKLARSLYDRMAIAGTDPATNIRETTTAAMSAIQLLSRSDKPELAMPLIRDVILDRQDDSAWHRHLLHVGFVQSLDAKAAKEFFDGFSESIMERANPKAKAKAAAAASAGEDKKPAPPAVKVTTIKMIAQMLNSPKFMDEKSACEILVRLFTTAYHIDIRVAILESLLSMLESSTTDEELKSYIFESLCKKVVPLAARVDERTFVKWEEVEELPVVGTETPIASLLVANRPGLSKQWRKKYVDGLLVDLLHRSADNHRKWINMFLSKNNLKLDEGILPAAPVHPFILTTFFQTYVDDCPREVFDLLRSYTLINLSPPPQLKEVHDAVSADKKLRNSDAGKHWLAKWNCGVQVLSYGNQILWSKLPNKADYWRELSETSGINVDDVGDFQFEVADKLIALGNTAQVVGLVTNAANKPEMMKLHKRITARVKELRTDEWQKDQKRMPAILPDPFDLALEAVPYSMPDETPEDYAGVIEVLMDLYLALGTSEPYHARFAKLKNAVVQRTTNAKDAKIKVAVILGALKSAEKVTLKDHLRVEIADGMFDTVYRTLGSNKEVLNVLRQWHESPVESIRVRAINKLTAIENSGAQGFRGMGGW